MTPQDANSWDKWQNHVLAELERMNKWLGEIQKTQNEMQSTISALNVKSGVWGFISGIIPAAAAFIWWHLKAK